MGTQSTIGLAEVKNEPSDLLEQSVPASSGNKNVLIQTSKPLPAHQGLSAKKSLVKLAQPVPKVDEVVQESVDISSIRGLFGWATVDGVYVPYLLREEKEYVAVRIVEQKLLARFPNTFPEELGRHEPLVSYYVTQNEMKLLDEINSVHCDFDYGHHKFASKDLIVKLTEFEDFYNLVKKTFPQEVLHARKAGVPLPAPEILASSKSGWIQVNNTVTPYFRRGMQKYVVLQIIRHAAKLLANVEVQSICPNEEEYNLINAMCSSAGLAFQFSKSTKLVSLDDVKMRHEVTLMELPLECPMKYAQYNNSKKEGVENQHPQANQPTAPAGPPSLLRNLAMPTQRPVQGNTAQGAAPRQAVRPLSNLHARTTGQHSQMHRLPVGQYPRQPTFPGSRGPNYRPQLQPQMPGSQQFSSVQQSLQMRAQKNVPDFRRQSVRPVQRNLPTSTANNATGFGIPMNQNPQPLHPLGAHMFRNGIVPHPPQRGVRMAGVSPYGNQIPTGSQQAVHMPVVSQHGIQMVGLPQHTLQQHPSMMHSIQQNQLAVSSQNFVPSMAPGLIRPQGTQQMPVVTSPFVQSQGFIQQSPQQQSSLIRPPLQTLHQQTSLTRPTSQPTQQQTALTRPTSQPLQQQSSFIRPISQPTQHQISLIRPTSQPLQQQSSFIRPISQPTQQQTSLIRPTSQPLQQQSSFIQPISQPTQQQTSLIRPTSQQLQQQSSFIRPISQPTQHQTSLIPPILQPPQQQTSLTTPTSQLLSQQTSSIQPISQPTQQQTSLTRPASQPPQQQSLLIRPPLQRPSQRPQQQSPAPTQPVSAEASPRMTTIQNIAPKNATHYVIPIVDPKGLNNDTLPNMNKVLQGAPFVPFLNSQQKQGCNQFNSKVVTAKKTVYPKIAPRQPIPCVHVPPSETITLTTDEPMLNVEGDEAEQEVSNGGDNVGLTKSSGPLSEQSSKQTLSQQTPAPETEGAPEALEVVKLSKCVRGVRFEGRSISCLDYNNLKGKHALVEAVCKLYFPRWKLNEFLYVLEQVLKIPTKACQPNEEKAFILYYHLPVPVLKCNKMVKLDDLSEHYTKLLYMFEKINGASKSASDSEESKAVDTSRDSPVIVSETLAPKENKEIVPLDGPAPLSDSSTETSVGVKRKHLSGPTKPSKQLKSLEDAVERLKQRPDPGNAATTNDHVPSTNENDEVSVIVIE